MASRPLGSFEYRVLRALLEWPHNAYGITIRERVGDEVSLRALYTTLDRLEKKGFVTSEWGEPTPERGGRRKRYFHIQPSGRDAVEKTGTMFTLGWNHDLALGGNAT